MACRLYCRINPKTHGLTAIQWAWGSLVGRGDEIRETRYKIQGGGRRGKKKRKGDLRRSGKERRNEKGNGREVIVVFAFKYIFLQKISIFGKQLSS